MRHRLPLLVIVMTVILDAMGIGLIIPVMPQLITEVRGGTIAGAAVWGGLLTTAYAMMQFLCAPAMGQLSDRFGRRPVLLISLVVMAADYVVMALAGSIWLLLAGRIVGGITGATQPIANAYVADISSPADKAARFGLIGAAVGVGFVLGPVIGGVLAEYGTRAPFWAAAALAGSNALLGAAVLTESLPFERRRRFAWRGVDPFSALRRIGAFVGIAPLLWVYFLYTVAGIVYPVIWAFFTAERFGWSPGVIGVSLAVYGLSMALIQGLMVRPVIFWLGHRRTVMLGLLLDLAALIYMTIIANGTVLMLSLPLLSLSGVALPALQAMLSRNVTDDMQGALQGVLGSLTALAMVLTPLVMTQTFATFSREDAAVYLPGAPFLLSAFLLPPAIWIFARWMRRP